MMKSWMGAALALASTLIACSSSNGGTGTPAQESACVTSLESTLPTCAACLETNCQPQITSAESGCSDFVSCICPGGTYNASDLTICEATGALQPTCPAATKAIETCASAHCATQCGADAG